MAISKQPHGDAYVSRLIETNAVEIETTERGIGMEVLEFDRVVDGKRYDTEKMEQIVEYDTSNHEFGNFWMQETLWLTRNKNWLLAGTGGGGTPWWDRDHNDSWGLAFVPLTADEAKGWLEARNFQTALTEYFEVEDA